MYHYRLKTTHPTPLQSILANIHNTQTMPPPSSSKSEKYTPPSSPLVLHRTPSSSSTQPFAHITVLPPLPRFSLRSTAPRSTRRRTLARLGLVCVVLIVGGSVWSEYVFGNGRGAGSAESGWVGGGAVLGGKDGEREGRHDWGESVGDGEGAWGVSREDYGYLGMGVGGGEGGDRNGNEKEKEKESDEPWSSDILAETMRRLKWVGHGGSSDQGQTQTQTQNMEQSEENAIEPPAEQQQPQDQQQQQASTTADDSVTPQPQPQPQNPDTESTTETEPPQDAITDTMREDYGYKDPVTALEQHVNAQESGQVEVLGLPEGEGLGSMDMGL
ncbi:hypothetical protein IQ07DRAFT_682791 [Pyrenochaeta sp. DS3sAY3a]|nr:hypothetical protein IQ07DRAFT_682791 [Pyrenochaeta sp. DS3sAY3a]